MKTIIIYLTQICFLLVISYGSYSQGNEKMKFPDASQFKIDKNSKTNNLPAKNWINYSKSEKKNFAPIIKYKNIEQVRKFSETSTKPNYNFNFEKVKEIKNVLPPLPEDKRFTGKKNLILPGNNTKFK